MKQISRCTMRALVSVLLLCFAVTLWGQDQLPEQARRDQNSGVVYPSREMQQLMELIAVTNPLPSTFKETKKNEIIDPECSLQGFWQKLERLSHPVRIVHIGDSHVRGHVFPYVMRRQLEGDFGSQAVLDMEVTYRTSGLAHETGRAGVVYHILGVNGATCATFSTPERIREVIRLNPDLIILSFGTNEAHARRYSSAEHKAQLNHLLTALKSGCPNAAFLLTTPPGAYVRNGRQGRVINPRTSYVADTERSFAQEHQLAVWDLYDIVGGKHHACRNWTAAHAFQRDKIHFTHEGYILQGLLLHEAFIKAYNDYVATQSDDTRY